MRRVQKHLNTIKFINHRRSVHFLIRPTNKWRTLSGAPEAIIIWKVLKKQHRSGRNYLLYFIAVNGLTTTFYYRLMEFISFRRGTRQVVGKSIQLAHQSSLPKYYRIYPLIWSCKQAIKKTQLKFYRVPSILAERVNLSLHLTEYYESSSKIRKIHTTWGQENAKVKEDRCHSIVRKEIERSRKTNR